MSEGALRIVRKIPRGVYVALVVLLAAVIAVRGTYRPFPAEDTPEGAYLRIAHGVTEDHVEASFPFLENEAQWASYTVRDNRKRSLELVRRSYPANEREPLEKAWGPFASAPDGADVFVLFAKERGWDRRLRRDLSGVASIDVQGERASVVTVRGTRYPFRKRPNGIWGLTIFTADLLAEAEKSTRDLAVVEKAAADYDHAKSEK